MRFLLLVSSVFVVAGRIGVDEAEHRRLQVLPSAVACKHGSPGAIVDPLCKLWDGFGEEKKEEVPVKEVDAKDTAEGPLMSQEGGSRVVVDKDETDTLVLVKEVEQKGTVMVSAGSQVSRWKPPQDVVFVQLVDVDVDQSSITSGADRIFGSTPSVELTPEGGGSTSAGPVMLGKDKPYRPNRRHKKKRKKMMTERNKRRGSSLHADGGSGTGRIFGGATAVQLAPVSPAHYSGYPSTSSKGKGKKKSKGGASRSSKTGKGTSGKASKGKGSNKSMDQSGLERVFGGTSSEGSFPETTESSSQLQGKSSSKGGSKKSKGSKGKSQSKGSAKYDM